MSNISNPFPDKKYNIIYADPSYKFKNANTGGNLNSGASNKYKVMSIEDICRLPVNNITADDCVLFQWWVGSMPLEALEIMRFWGFKLKTMTGFTWVKKTKTWKDWFGMGFWTRQGTENILIAIKGKPKRLNAGIRQVLECDFNESIKAVNEKHSKKPDIFRDRIVELMGDLSRIELFARDRVEGWDAWGDEI